MALDENIGFLLEEGQTLGGRYRLGGVLGAGGFAAVYEGFDLMIERPVAIKVLNVLGTAHDPVLRARATARFRQESRLAALIRHPNVITIHDVGVTAEKALPFIVMELLTGHTLGQELSQRGPMAAARVLPLVCKVLSGLAVGHDLGVVHKDLKPSNLFLIHPGEPREDIRIVDFGIARMDTEIEALTGTGQVAGTPQYLAPEYIVDKTTTPALDIYQMGLILSELLSGVRAVEGPHLMSCMIKHTHGQLTLPAELLDSPLGPILIKATALDPTDRYDHAERMRLALLEIDPATLPTMRRPNKLALSNDSGELVHAVAESGTFDTSSVEAESEYEAMRASQVAFAPELDQDNAESLEAVIPPEAPAPVRARWPVAAVAVTVVALLLGGAWWLQEAPGDVPAPPAPQAEAVPEPSPMATPPPEEAPKPTVTPAIETAPPRSEPKPKPIAIQVQTMPCRAAQLFEGRQKLGQTPHTLTFDAPNAAERRIVVRCKGYKPRMIKVSPTSDSTLKVRLQPVIQLPD